MLTDRPLKSVNLDPEDHELAKKIAQALTEQVAKQAPNPVLSTIVNTRGAVKYALIQAARELGIE